MLSASMPVCFIVVEGPTRIYVYDGLVSTLYYDDGALVEKRFSKFLSPSLKDLFYFAI